jgi:predicted  nucleic acid-binding Zn-ribbon protein
MPHQCTDCGHTFPDGSKEMLSGCPDCGGNKFQFQPASDARESAPSNPSPETESTYEPASSTESTPIDESAPAGDSATSEDRAQADARCDMATRDELAAESAEPDSDSDRGTEPKTTAEPEPPAEADKESNMTELRQELNDQFESIKILEPGQYELNLMELYNREEFIIALQEDGQYVIEVPETWL